MCECGSGLSETSSLSILSFHFFSASEHCTFLQSCSSLLTKHGRSIFYPSGSGAISSFCFNLFCFGSSICITANMARLFISVTHCKRNQAISNLSSASRLHVQDPYKQEKKCQEFQEKIYGGKSNQKLLDLSSNRVKHGQNPPAFFLNMHHSTVRIQI